MFNVIKHICVTQWNIKNGGSKVSELDDLKRELRKVKDINQNLMDVLEEKDKEEKIKKNLNFVQLYKQHLKDLRKLTQADKNALTVLLIMVEKMNKQNALVISQANLMKITGKSRTSIHNAIKALKKHKFIEVIKIGTSNAYVVNSNVFWQNQHDKKEMYAVFDATVYASMDEQEEEYQEDWKGIKLKSVPILNEEIALDEKGKKYALNAKTKELTEIKDEEENNG